jgi:hypothetical protein
MLINVKNLSGRLARARCQIGRGIAYEMGRGGYNSQFPNDAGWDDHKSDCTGFALSFCAYMDRNAKPGREWDICSSSAWDDAMGLQKVYRRILEPAPGCFVIYPEDGSPDGAGHDAIWVGPGWHVVDCCASVGGVSEHEQLAFCRNPKTIFAVLVEDVE